MGGVGVQALPEEPLFVVLLEVAGGDVVEDGVTPDMVERIGLADSAPALADDDAEFGFVI
jgi:hypothetical protein